MSYIFLQKLLNLLISFHIDKLFFFSFHTNFQSDLNFVGSASWKRSCRFGHTSRRKHQRRQHWLCGMGSSEREREEWNTSLQAMLDRSKGGLGIPRSWRKNLWEDQLLVEKEIQEPSEWNRDKFEDYLVKTKKMGDLMPAHDASLSQFNKRNSLCW